MGVFPNSCRCLCCICFPMRKFATSTLVLWVQLCVRCPNMRAVFSTSALSRRGTIKSHVTESAVHDKATLCARRKGVSVCLTLPWADWRRYTAAQLEHVPHCGGNQIPCHSGAGCLAIDSHPIGHFTTMNLTAYRFSAQRQDTLFGAIHS